MRRRNKSKEPMYLIVHDGEVVTEVSNAKDIEDEINTDIEANCYDEEDAKNYAVWVRSSIKVKIEASVRAYVMIPRVG